MKRVFNGFVISKHVMLNHEFRMRAVMKILRRYKPVATLDVGSGDGQFIERLKKERWAQKIIGIEPGREYFKKSLRLVKTEVDRKRIFLKNLSLFKLPASFIQEYRGLDALTLIEVIEHIYPKDILKLNEVIFKKLQPKIVIVTTPNAIFRLSKEDMKKFDHKFEWNDIECKEWGEKVAKKYGYSFSHHLVRRKVSKRGSQMCVFKKKS